MELTGERLLVGALVALEEFALEREEKGTFAMNDALSAKDVLQALGRPKTLSAADDLLKAVGWWAPHENLSLLRNGTPLTFTPEQVLAPHRSPNNYYSD
jgi:hypothetical protein